MKQTETQSDMNKPLTKGDFLLFQLDKWRAVYAVLWLILGSVGLVLVGGSCLWFFYACKLV